MIRQPGRYDAIAIAAFFALLTGLIEAGGFLFQSLMRHRLVWVSTDVLWMAPVSYLVFFFAFAVLLIAIGIIRRRPIGTAWIAGLYAFLSVLSLLLPFTQIALVASAILAAGVALQLARSVRASSDAWTRGFRRGAVVLLALVTTLGFAGRALLAERERRALGALPAWDQGAPNILLIVLDTVRRSNLSLYHYPRPTTPRLEQWARDGVVFDGAVVAAPWTLPSHASMFTGLPHGSLSTDWQIPLLPGPRTLAEVLREHGYLTAGFVGNLLYTSWSSGLSRGFVHYDDYVVSPVLVMLHSSLGRSHLYNALRFAFPSPRPMLRALRGFDLRKTINAADRERNAESVADAFLAWQRTTGPRPFFAFLNFFDAHNARQAPDRWLATFGGARPSRVDLYDGAVAYLDHEVGRILDSLRQRGVLDRTIVVVTSDHGEQFGEHRLYSHGNSLYLPLLTVPLVVRYPGAVPAGRRVAPLISLRDLAATILDLAGIADHDGIPGTSLAGTWRDRAPAPRAPLLAELTKGINVDTLRPNSRGPMSSLLDEHWHYIRNGWGREELYAWPADTLELTNLAAAPAGAMDLPRLRRQLDSALAEARRRR